MLRHGRESGRFVFPGDPLGVVEEFVPRYGTYEEGGTIYSGVTGIMLVDVKNKSISVYPRTKVPNIPREGSTVIGMVTNVQDKMAFVSLFKIGNRALSNPFTGVLHISSSSPKFEKDMMRVCKVGDIIKAKVLDAANRIPVLTTAGRGLGVVGAYCSRCGGPLALSNRKLLCHRCGSSETRRIAEDYGKKLKL